MSVYNNYVVSVGTRLSAKKSAEQARAVDLQSAAAQLLSYVQHYAQAPGTYSDALVLTSSDDVNGKAKNPTDLSDFSDDVHTLRFGIGFTAYSGANSLGTVGLPIVLRWTGQQGKYSVEINSKKHDFIPNNAASVNIGAAVWIAITHAFDKKMGL